MKIHSTRRSLAGWLVALAAGLVVAGCGGGGASSSNSPNQGGQPQMQPDGATFYAGVPSKIFITGGFRPYTVTSTEPSLLGFPSPINSGTIDVVPANPGVIDANLPPGSLPIRTVIIQARDRLGNISPSITIKVAQNFLTGYGVGFSSNCPTTAGSASPPACAGGETTIRLTSVTNGNLYGNRAVRFEVLRGPYQFVQLPGTTVLGQTFTTTTDHAGNALALIRVNQGVVGQFAVVRIVDVATGVYVDQVFPISAAGPQSVLQAIPNTFSFTGPLQGVCGTGTGQFTVFDGQPPYTATSSNPNVTVSPPVNNSNPATFTITAFNPNVCVTGATIIVTDSLGGRTTVTVNTAEGTATIEPPPDVAVAPSTITLACGTSGSVSVVGGGGGFVVNSTHPRITAILSGNTLTITRLAGDAPGSSFPTGGTISVTDGRTTATVTVTAPANCP